MLSISVPASFRITSKETALQLYDHMETTIFVRTDDGLYLRIEPNRRIAIITRDEFRNSMSLQIPSDFDEDGSAAYHYREHINNWLSYNPDNLLSDK